MADKETRLFAPEKLKWLLTGGLQTLEPSERQMLLIMAETQLQDGYKPTNEEKQVIEELRSLAGDDYDSRDIRRKVKKMVKGRSKPDSPPLKLPPVFDRLIGRFDRSKENED